METRHKLRLIQGLILIGALGGVFALMRLILPAGSHTRRLFDLGEGYQRTRIGLTYIYHQPEVVPKDKVLELCRDFSAFVEGMVKIWAPPLGIAMPEAPVEILLHSNEEDYNRYWRLYKSDRADSAGRYRNSDSTIGIKGFESNERALETMRHEMVHLLLDRSGLTGGFGEVMPTWLNEGLASYFEKSYEGGTDRSYGADPPPVPLDKLVALSPTEFYDKDAPVHDHYTESTLLVAFFMEAEDSRYRTKFLEYIRGICRRPCRLGPLAGVFELHEDELTERWLIFLKTRQAPLPRKP